MQRLLALLTTVLGLALGGCQMTVLENLPQGAQGECPAEVLGAWIGVEDSGQDTSDFGVFVHKDCTIESRGRDGAHPAHPPLPHARFFSGAGKQLMLLPTADAYELAEVKPDDNSKAGYLIFAWQRSGEQIELQAPDHRHVAHLIVDGAVQGRTSWSNDNRAASAFNFLSGDGAAIAQMLERTDLFGETKSMRLRRVGDDEKALNRALHAATSKAMKAGKERK